MVSVMENMALSVEKKKRVFIRVSYMAKTYFKLIIIGCIAISLGALVFQKEEIKAANTSPVPEEPEQVDLVGNSNDGVDIPHHIVTLSTSKTAYQQLDSQKEGRANTTYVIHSDFDLEGGNINMPENCVLRFNGGLLKNGTVVGNNTNIEASPRQIFSTNINLKGSWCIAQAFVEWYGAKAITKYNKVAALKNATAIQLAANTFQNVSFAANSNNNAFYYVTAEKGSKCVINIYKPVTLSGINQVSTQIVYVGESDLPVFCLTKSDAEHIFGPRYASIQNMCIRGLNDKYRNGTAIYVENGVAHVKFENLYFCYFNECFVCDSWSVQLNTCKAEVSNVGFRLGVNHQGMPGVNLTRCSTGYCKTAYSLKGIYYSTMLNCSSDFCDVVWYINDCMGISFMTAGAERCHQFMNVGGKITKNIIVSNAFVWLSKNNEMTQEQWNNFILIGEKAQNIKFDNLYLDLEEPQNLSKQINRDKHFIKIKGNNKSRVSITNSYCSRGDLNYYIFYEK